MANFNHRAIRLPECDCGNRPGRNPEKSCKFATEYARIRDEDKETLVITGNSGSIFLMDRYRTLRRSLSAMKRPGAGAPAALALAIAMLPANGAAQGFWHTSRDSGQSAALPLERASTSFAFDASGLVDQRPQAWEGEASSMIGLPGTRSRFGLAMTQKDGRPSFDGLAFQAAPNMRISADGDYDFDDGSLSGQVKLQFDF